MIAIRKSDERGHVQHGWLDTKHTFSFASYQDPQHMGYRSLRVINEDHVAPGEGFGMHPHRDMEILTYVVSGELEHKDSLGNGSRIRPGEIQAMSAGTGLLHSEFNPSENQPVHLLQIWLKPKAHGLKPRYEQRSIQVRAQKGQPVLVASSDGRDGSLTIQQDATLHAAALDAGQSFKHALKEGRHAWVQVVSGQIALNDTALKAGDGASVSGETALELLAAEPSEVLLFDLN